MNDLAAFARLIEAIEPWRGHLVVVGGWAHRLYRFHPLASVPDYDPLVTRDTDLAFGTNAPLTGNIREAVAAQGFGETLSGDDTPPVTHYTLGDEDAGFYAEFLTPLVGSEIKKGKRDLSESKAGITAQKPRYLETLLVAPWMVRLGAGEGVPLKKPADVQLANPVSFIVQKLLIHARRHPSKRAQDVLYVHDTLDLFGPRLDDLAAVWRSSVRPALSRNAEREATRLSGQLFSAVTDTIRDAVRVPSGRTLDPGRVAAACRAGLSEVFAIA